MNIFKSLLRFDIFLCAQEYVSERLDLINVGEVIDFKGLPKKGIFIRILSFIFTGIRSCGVNLNTSEKKEIHVFLVNNSYEVRALKPITKYLNQSEIVWLGISAKEAEIDHNLYHPFSGYLFGLLFIPLLIFKFLISKPNEKKAVPYIFDNLLYAVGFFLPYSLFLKKHNIKSIYVSNHNSPLSALAIELGVSYKLNLTYIEHTILIDRWPKIKCNNFLLSGELSKNNLKKINDNYIDCKVELIGSPKNDELEIKKKYQNDKVIGIAINHADNVDKILSLVTELRLSFPNKALFIRPHPAMVISKGLTELLIKNNVSLIEPEKVLLKEFFKIIDIIIVNDSGIYFESGYVGIFPLKYQLSENPSDYSVPNNFFRKVFLRTQDLIREIESFSKTPEEIRSEFKKVYINIDDENDFNATKALKQGLKNLKLI